MKLLTISLAVLLLCGTSPVSGQEEDLTDLFDQDPFYERAGILRAKGDVPFYADVSFLKGSADSTQALLGIALSSNTFQFIKESSGYRAAYEVAVRIEGPSGSFRHKWREGLTVGSFDETLLGSETIVFQSAFGLLPGKFDLELEVRDAQGGRESKIETKLDVPRIWTSAQSALSQPILLRSFDEAAAGPTREHVLYPSHYYEAVPQEVHFLVEVYGAAETGGAPLRLATSLAPAEGGPAVANTTLDVPALEDGVARVYGSVPGSEMQSGLYELRVALQDASGSTLAESSTKLSVSAITQWVKEHWKEAVELLAYEASDEERETLEGAPSAERLAVWREFWQVRDPIPATPGNEAFENYFQRITTANANFGTKLRPGWKSDRGRVFVAFGPPSDVVRRPISTDSFPFEVWVYDTPAFEIVFEDRIGFGNYQIANPGTFANELAALERRKRRAIEQRREALRQEEGREDETSPADTARG